MAGTVGGGTYGVARKASLVSVRVLDCKGSGDYAGIIAGIDWIAKNAVKPAVMNASLGGPQSLAVQHGRRRPAPRRRPARRRGREQRRRRL
ncbi:S8 family serine peptidase [Streptomyces sp. enrichment culture]|uniref:S8 family serine peptidase n=1 Tax=Streptomyces sp. enrichment culture TaxID=1795815 RepID=UPI003F55AA87